MSKSSFVWYLWPWAELLSWLFLNFFAEALIRVVQKEDEIWLLESGMRSAFYRWIRRDEPE